MPDLTVDLRPDPNDSSREPIRIEASGRSTTTGKGWSLGFLDAELVGGGASAWLTEYLNRPVEGATNGKRIHGKKRRAEFALARSPESTAGLSLEEYPDCFPVLEKRRSSPEYAARFKGQRRRFADFAPFLLVNRASARDLAARAGVDTYPIRSFRGNIVVEAGGDGAWAEEGWSEIEIRGDAGGAPGRAPRKLRLRKIKECPRCTVPCRDETTGRFLFPGRSTLLWKVLGRAFPRKRHDPEWGLWEGVFFGVYMGNPDVSLIDARGGGATIAVGDEVAVTRRRPWDAHLRRTCDLGTVAAVAAVASAVAVAAFAATGGAPLAAIADALLPL
jgi:hypothetical protein